MLCEQITAGQLINKECTMMHIHDTKIYCDIHAGIMSKYIAHHLTASMTNNLSSECHPSKLWVLSCKQQIIDLSKVRNVSNTIILRQSTVVLPYWQQPMHNLRSYCPSPRLLRA